MDHVRYDLAGHHNGSRPSPDAAVGAAPRASSRPAADAAALQQALSEVTHDLNNPLAIISGNAQLLLELARMLDLDPDVAKPIQDIEEASHRLAAMVHRLNELKENIAEVPSEGREG